MSWVMRSTVEIVYLGPPTIWPHIITREEQAQERLGWWDSWPHPNRLTHQFITSIRNWWFVFANWVGPDKTPRTDRSCASLCARSICLFRENNRSSNRITCNSSLRIILNYSCCLCNLVLLLKLQSLCGINLILYMQVEYHFFFDFLLFQRLHIITSKFTSFFSSFS